MEFLNFGQNRRKLGDLLRSITNLPQLNQSATQSGEMNSLASYVIKKLENDRHKIIEFVEKHPHDQFYTKKIGECHFSNINQYKQIESTVADYFGFRQVEFIFKYNENLKRCDKIDTYNGDFEIKMKFYL